MLISNENSFLTQLFKNIDFSEGILSIWGDIGVGKTTLALQIALNFSQQNEKVIFIYTKDEFPSLKFENLKSKIDKEKSNNSIFIKIEDFDDLLEYVLNLEFVLLDLKRVENKNISQIQLIIIDSPFDLYSLKTDKTKKKKNVELNYKLNQILATLTNLNQRFGINVIITNYETTIKENEKYYIKEKGGKVTEYWVPNTIQILRTENMSERIFLLKNRPQLIIYEIKAKLDDSGFNEIK